MANWTNLSNLISSIQKIMRKDAWVNGDAQRLEQISWMLFLKLFDDKEQEYELMKDNYQSPIPEKLQWRNWAGDDEWITGETLIDFVTTELFPWLKKIEVREDIPMTYIIRSVFEDANNYIKSWTIMRQVINKLDEIDFNKKDEAHIFNDIYEKLLNDLQSAGNAGEFYTPRAVTQFMVERVQPKLWQKISDIACGTGWFLTGALEYIRKNDVKTAEDEKLLQNSIYWTELKQLPHILATTNMILHGIETPINIRHADSLAKPVNDITDKDMTDIILMNPPFGGSIEDWIEYNFPAKFRTKETAKLFMVLIIEILRNGWKAGVVLPDWFMFDTSDIWIAIKEKLLDECNLHTIIRLPKSVFAPYATVATNLLFFTKGEPTKEIWYYRVDMPEWYKAFSKTKPIQLKHLDCAKDWWDNRIEIKDEVVEWGAETWKAKKFTVDEIKNLGYDLDLCGYPTEVEGEILSPEETANNFIKRREELEAQLDEKINKILSLMK